MPPKPARAPPPSDLQVCSVPPPFFLGRRGRDIHGCVGKPRASRGGGTRLQSQHIHQGVRGCAPPCRGAGARRGRGRAAGGAGGRRRRAGPCGARRPTRSSRRTSRPPSRPGSGSAARRCAPSSPRRSARRSRCVWARRPLPPIPPPRPVPAPSPPPWPHSQGRPASATRASRPPPWHGGGGGAAGAGGGEQVPKGGRPRLEPVAAAPARRAPVAGHLG